LNSSQDNPTYTTNKLSKDVIDNHKKSLKIPKV